MPLVLRLSTPPAERRAAGVRLMQPAWHARSLYANLGFDVREPLRMMQGKALIAAARAFAGPGFLLPARQAEVLRWCLGKGLRVVQPMSLMAHGLYHDPLGAFLPSILL
jgi:hypothetical protein